jgi:uncharacterized membrane protein
MAGTVCNVLLVLTFIPLLFDNAAASALPVCLIGVLGLGVYLDCATAAPIAIKAASRGRDP